MPRLPLRAALLVCVFASACSVGQELHMRSDGSGSTHLEITLHPVIVQYLSDLIDGFARPRGNAAGGPPPLYDVAAVLEAFSEVAAAGVTLEKLETPRRETLIVACSFLNVAAALPRGSMSPGVPALLSFERSGDEKRFTVHLSRDTYGQLAPFLGRADSPAAVLVPVRREDFFDELEYRELFDYAFEDYVPDRRPGRVLDSSVVAVTVRVDGRIVRQAGGRISGDSVVFEIPFVRLVTLETPLILEVVWK